MKEYIVTKPVLNIRNSASVANDANFIGQVSQGEILYLDPQTVTGDVPKGGKSDQWHPDLFNRVVASEGVALYDFNQKVKLFVADDTFKNLHQGTPIYQNWHVNWGFADQEIWKFWKDFGTRGKGVKVAVIDMGVNHSANDLQGRISAKSVSTIGPDPANFSDISPNRHGTKSAGLIGASGASAVFGIAPDCELIVIKAGDAGFNAGDILPAMNEAIALGAQIISMSIEYYRPLQALGAIDALLAKHVDNPILFVAAAGDNGDPSISYPASFNGCFSVGSYGLTAANARIVDINNNVNSKLKFLCPGVNILSCSDNGSALYNMSSAATAFASGVMALISSALNRVPTYNQVLAALKTGQCTQQIAALTPFSDTEGYGVLSPYQLLKILKTIA
jgi:subtilisin family serine protease